MDVALEAMGSWCLWGGWKARLDPKGLFHPEHSMIFCAPGSQGQDYLELNLPDKSWFKISPQLGKFDPLEVEFALLGLPWAEFFPKIVSEEGFLGFLDKILFPIH